MNYNGHVLKERLDRLAQHLEEGQRIVQRESHGLDDFADYEEPFLISVMHLAHRAEQLVNEIRTTIK